jgi:hypothetical protein
MVPKQKTIFVALAAVAFFGACSDDTPFTPGLLNKLFGATLTIADEVPAPVGAPTSSGTANITMIDTNTIRVQTIVSSIDSVTQAHIHAGSPGVPGPIMVFLSGPFGTALVARGANSVTTLNGVLSHVDITRSTAFTGVFNFDSVRFRVENGTAYVNVHTRKNPGGEIRGQVLAK